VSSVEVSQKLLEALERSDAWRRQGRAERIAWISEHDVAYELISGPMDTLRLLAEARECFVDAHYVATLILAVAYIEHTLMDELTERGFAAGVRTLEQAIKRSGHYDLFEKALLDRADKLRAIRNPFTHRRESTDPDTFPSRYLAQKRHPDLVLEDDAKESLKVMYEFFRLTLKAPNPQVELTAKQRRRCLVPVMLRMPAAAHLQR
jgi:hypothetical protein